MTVHHVVDSQWGALPWQQWEVRIVFVFTFSNFRLALCVVFFADMSDSFGKLSVTKTCTAAHCLFCRSNIVDLSSPLLNEHMLGYTCVNVVTQLWSIIAQRRQFTTTTTVATSIG